MMRSFIKMLPKLQFCEAYQACTLGLQTSIRIKKLPTIFCLLFLALSLFGCAGDMDTTPVENKLISLALVNAKDQNIETINPAVTGRLVAKLTDAVGKPIAGEMINFTAKMASTRPKDGNAITDKDGKAVVELVSGPESGAGEAKATFGEYSATIKFMVDADIDINLALKLVKVSGIGAGEETGKISAVSPGRLEAVLTYSTKSIPIARQTLQFSATAGSIQPTDGTAITDALGKAAVDILAGLKAGEGEATVKFGENYSAKVGFVIEEQDISISIVMVTKKSWETSPDDPAAWEISTILSSDNPACLVATLKYVSGNPVPDKLVKFTTTLGSLIPVGQPIDELPEEVKSDATALTDKNGRAVVYLVGGAEPGAGEAKAIYGNYPPAAAGFTTPGDQRIEISLQLLDDKGKNTLEINANSPGRLQAILTYGPDKTPIPDALIQFTTTLGELKPKEGTALTDKDGKASVELFAGTKSGAGKATATYGKYSATVNFSTLGDTPATTVSISLKLVDGTGKALTTISAGTSGKLVAVLTDSGKPVVGKLVNFSTTLGKIDPEAGTGLTDDTGSASVMLIAGAKAGSGVATAKYEEYSATVNFVTLGDEQEGNKISLRLDGTSSIIGVGETGTLIAKLTTTSGTPIPDKTIKFITTVGLIEPVEGEAKTNGQGEAVVFLKAGPIPGSGIVTATYEELSERLSFYVKEKDETTKPPEVYLVTTEIVFHL